MKEPEEAGDQVRNALARDWVKIEAHLRGYLMRAFASVSSYHDEIISDAMFGTLQNAAEIEAKFQPGRLDIVKYVHAYIRQSVKWGALSALTKSGKRESIADHSDRDEEDEALERLPTPIAVAEQEEIVFLKQVLETLGYYPKEEWAAMRDVTSRAELSEICSQAGVLRDVLAAMRRGDMRGIGMLKRKLSA